MSIWRALWCFYNSGAFETVASLALLGAIGIIVPALITLPKRDAPTGAQTSYINFKSARRCTFWLGVTTAVFSIGPPSLYFFLLSKMGGETCNVDEQIASSLFIQLIGLYALTALVLVGFGWFYIKWQQVLRLNESLDK